MKLALFVTVKLDEAVFVSAPVEDRMRLLLVLVDVRLVAEFSAILTAPAELNVRLPKLMVSPD